MCPKAYRWHGEMEEIADTYEDVGMTGKVYRGIADVYRCVIYAWWQTTEQGAAPRQCSLRLGCC